METIPDFAFDPWFLEFARTVTRVEKSIAARIEREHGYEPDVCRKMARAEFSEDMRRQCEKEAVAREKAKLA